MDTEKLIKIKCPVHGTEMIYQEINEKHPEPSIFYEPGTTAKLICRLGCRMELGVENGNLTTAST